MARPGLMWISSGGDSWKSVAVSPVSMSRCWRHLSFEHAKLVVSVCAVQKGADSSSSARGFVQFAAVVASAVSENVPSVEAGLIAKLIQDVLVVHFLYLSSEVCVHNRVFYVLCTTLHMAISSDMVILSTQGSFFVVKEISKVTWSVALISAVNSCCILKYS